MALNRNGIIAKAIERDRFNYKAWRKKWLVSLQRHLTLCGFPFDLDDLAEKIGDYILPPTPAKFAKTFLERYLARYAALETLPHFDISPLIGPKRGAIWVHMAKLIDWEKSDIWLTDGRRFPKGHLPVHNGIRKGEAPDRRRFVPTILDDVNESDDADKD